ncbi:MAG: hypothetical protein IID54_06245, partial [Proteobacteria bacterium]|nr:hypothetical protein [Pseudomonadota bacterium]
FLGNAQARVRLVRRIVAEGFDVLSIGDAPRQLEETYFLETANRAKKPPAKGPR